MIREFVKKNKIITIIGGVSLAICIAYILSIDKKEWFHHAGDWFNLLFQLAIGFIINFIFYVMQVYIPHYQQNKEACRCIGVRVENIVKHMRILLSYLGSHYMGEYNESSANDDYWESLLRKIGTKDKIEALKISRMTSTYVTEEMKYTVEEWIIGHKNSVEKEIDNLMKYYAQYINTELMMSLENIMKSNMHQSVSRTYLQFPEGVSFDKFEGDNFLKQYYVLMKRLEVIAKHYMC